METEQEIKTSVLSILNTFPQGISEPLLMDKVRMRISPDLTRPQLEKLLRDLADAKHAISLRPALGEKRWRVTAEGKAALEEVGLA